MEGHSPCQLPPGKRPWKISVPMAVAVAVAVVVTLAVGVVVAVVLAVAVPTVLCQKAMGSAMAANTLVGLVRLEKELIITNQSLSEARWQRDQCKKQLGTLEGKVAELEQVMVKMTQLEEENRALKAEVAQQQKQLEDLQSHRDEVQLQNQLLEKQIQDVRSQYSGGNRIPAVSFSLLVLLLLPGMLLL